MAIDLLLRRRMMQGEWTPQQDHDTNIYAYNTGNCYVDTGIQYNNGYSVELKYKTTKAINNSMFGARIGYLNNEFCVRTNGTIIYGNHNIADMQVHTPLNLPSSVKMICNKLYSNGVYQTDFNENIFNTPNLYMFAENNNGVAFGYTQYNFYYLKIWDANNNLIAYIHPVIGETARLYDEARNMYLDVIGTTLTIGGDI